MRSRLILLMLTLLLLASCVMPGEQTATPATLTPTDTPLPTAGPTPTPTPIVPLTILVLPADMPADQKDVYVNMIYDLAYAAGVRFQLLNTLTAADLQFAGPGLKVVVIFPPDPGLAGLTAAAPQAQFLAIGIPGLPAAPNLSTIGAAGRPADQQAFLAGYIAAMISLDYRTGMITEKDDPDGLAAETAFINGTYFWCGRCIPHFPPWGPYPFHVEIPPATPVGQYTSFADALLDHLVEVAYVYPDVADADMLYYMTQYGMLLIGETLPSEDVRQNWVISIKPDIVPAIQRIFPELLAGRGGQILPVPLYLTDINSGLLSEVKQRLVEEVLADLQAGYIDTGVQR